MSDTVCRRAAAFVVAEAKAGTPWEDIEAALLLCAAQCAFRASRGSAVLFVQDAANA